MDLEKYKEEAFKNDDFKKMVDDNDYFTAFVYNIKKNIQIKIEKKCFIYIVDGISIIESDDEEKIELNKEENITFKKNREISIENMGNNLKIIAVFFKQGYDVAERYLSEELLRNGTVDLSGFSIDRLSGHQPRYSSRSRTIELSPHGKHKEVERSSTNIGKIYNVYESSGDIIYENSEDNITLSSHDGTTHDPIFLIGGKKYTKKEMRKKYLDMKKKSLDMNKKYLDMKKKYLNLKKSNL